MSQATPAAVDNSPPLSTAGKPIKTQVQLFTQAGPQQFASRKKAEGSAIVTRRTLHTVLLKSLAKEVSVSNLVAWATVLEAHDRFEYEPDFERLVADLVFRLASPEINGSLDARSCREILDQLG